MRYTIAVLLSLCLLGSLSIGQKKSTSKTQPVLKDQKDKISYIIGLNIGKDMKSRSMDINPDALARGLKDALSDAKALLTEDEIKQISEDFQREMMEKQQSEMAKAAEKAKKEGAAFLEANGKKDSVVTLPSGLQYKVLVPGTGRTPKAADTVVTHYRGRLIDGTEFDNSFNRGTPATFPVGGVIKGWVEALQLMKEGAKWQLYIPSDLAYGDRGAGQQIPPGSVLIFDIELISIK